MPVENEAIFYILGCNDLRYFAYLSSSSSVFLVRVSYMKLAGPASLSLSLSFSSISHGLLHLPPSASFLSDPLTNSHSTKLFAYL